MLSFIASGTPARGSSSPAATRRSTSRASLSASSPVTSRKARTRPSPTAIASRDSRVTSTALRRREETSAAVSMTPGMPPSAPRSDDARHHPVVVHPPRGIGLQGLGAPAVPRNVGPSGCRRGAPGGREGLLGDLPELLDVADDARELLRPARKFALGEAEPGEGGDLAHDLGSDNGRRGWHPQNCTSPMRRNPSRDLSRMLLRLRRRGEVRSLARVIRELGLEAWLVGGAVRDAGLRIADSEIDVAVSGNAEAVARALESAGVGRAVFLSRDRPGPRVFRVAGRRPLDIAEIEGGSIEKDLERRDFTVNALAVSLARREPPGSVRRTGRPRPPSPPPGPRFEPARRPASRAPRGAPLRDPGPRARPADSRRRACGGSAARRAWRRSASARSSPGSWKAHGPRSRCGGRRPPGSSGRRWAFPSRQERPRNSPPPSARSTIRPPCACPHRSGAGFASPRWRSRSTPKPGTPGRGSWEDGSPVAMPKTPPGSPSWSGGLPGRGRSGSSRGTPGAGSSKQDLSPARPSTCSSASGGGRIGVRGTSHGCGGWRGGRAGGSRSGAGTSWSGSGSPPVLRSGDFFRSSRSRLLQDR